MRKIAKVAGWLLLMSLFASHLYFSCQLFLMRQQVQAFERAQGLAAQASNRLTLSEVPLGVRDRWKLFGERDKERTLKICMISEEIDRWPRYDNVISGPIDSWIYSDRHHNLPWFELYWHVDRDGPLTKIKARNKFHDSLTFPSDHPLHQRSLDELTVEILPDPPDAAEPDAPRLLMRISDPQTPGRGFVMWIEDRPFDPRIDR